MSFSSEAWDAAHDGFDRIIEHPFLVGLADGTLPWPVFERYLCDDAHYLDRYARVLALLAAKAPTIADVGTMAEFAAGAAVAERALHEGQLGEAITASAPSSTCDAYTGFLWSTATTAPAAVGLAAVLPCFKVYAEVGQRLHQAQRDDHPYREWIATYADPSFADATRRCEDLADRWAVADPAALSAMHEAYARAVDYEWRFWDTAWHD
ncbi:thiaminase II [Aeromicrobium phragmitis]|uniref:Thiaminase II n=1 Tax=Aeromicrobium phragmitis TaxID=2478914 RepID=A0A3L8PNZ7_9ACTN|nr:TenA family protein [Aeromicrobium phragmitis]RLV56904.1 thiaminase II [Aeromicrobium phragmitis]